MSVSRHIVTGAIGDGLECVAVGEEDSRRYSLRRCNRAFESMSAEERVRWALKNLPSTHVASSSFGAQAAVTLHMLTTLKPDIPIVMIDTGYLFPETYRFVDALSDRLDLNLKVYRAPISPAWQEARYGKRWEKGVAELGLYNEQVKVEPMKVALRDLSVRTWFAGLRRSQAASRANTPYLEWSGGRWKVHPIADWTDRDVHYYLREHDLPYHPLWEQGYVSIGDHHSTRPIQDVDDREKTRFLGLKRECGLHEFDLSTV